MKYTQKGQGEIVVLIHGFLSGKDYWKEQINYFSQFFEVFTLEIKGYGERCNETGFSSIEDYSNEIIEFFKHKSLNKINLIGHSMGGMIAQEIALSIPEKIQKLVLYSTGCIGNLPGRFETIEKSIEKVQKGNLHSAIENTVSSWFLKRKESHFYQESVKVALQASCDTYINGLRAMSQWSSLDRIEKNDLPTLILWGDCDRSYPWKQIEILWTKIKNSNLCVIPQTAHNVHLEKIKLFNQIITEFLKNNLFY